MATLEKLSICGIRSFGEDEVGRQVIPFDKPVTLILGENGCGKSTIIECLRFVTTQKEPTGKGVFVRDPDLTGNSTVKASIKLRLKNIRGDDVHLCRGMQATRARKTITTKTLDSTITVIKPGEEPKQISSRCGDMQGETIRLLGISKAILDNVIFCSQDDTFWPLETDKALKEKFDLIFDSDKYNKCLNKVKDLQKKLKGKKGQLEQDVAYHKEKKVAAQGKRREVAKIATNMNALKDELASLDASLGPIYDKLKDVDNREKELSKVYTSRETTKTELNGVEREEKELRERLAGHEFAGSNEELLMALAECNSQSKNTNELKAELLTLKNEEQSVTDQINSNLGRIGQLSKVVEINKGKMAEKAQKITHIADLLKVPATESDLSKFISDGKKQIVLTQREHEMSEEACHAKVNEARDDVVNKEGDIRRIEEAIAENKREMAEIKRDLDSAGESQIRRERLLDDLRIAERQLKEHVQGNDATRWTTQLQNIQEELKMSENELFEAEKELKRVQSHAETGRELEYLTVEFNKKDAEVRRLKNSHREMLIELLGNEPQTNFKQALEKRADQLAALGKDLRNQKASREGAKIAIRSSVTQINSLIQKKNIEVQNFTDQLYELTNGAELNETIDITNTRVNELQKEKGDLGACSHMYNNYVTALRRKKPCCPLCARDFAAEKEAEILVETLLKKMRDVPDRMQKVEKELAEKLDYQRKLFDMHSQQKKIDVLQQEEIPALTREQNEKKAAVTQATRDVEELEHKLNKIEREKESCTNMFGDMALIDQSFKVIEKLKSDIQRIEPLLPPGWNKDLLKSSEEERDRIATKRKQLEKERETIQRTLNEYNEKLQTLQNKKHRLAEEELSLRSKDGQTKQQEDRLKALKNIEMSLLDEIEKAREQITPLEDAHNQRLSELKRLRETNKAALKAQQTKLDGIMAQYRDVERLAGEISDFFRRGDETKLTGLKKDITEREQMLKTTKIKIENVNSKLGDLAKIEVRRHNLEDNKALRGKIRAKEELVKKLAELEDKFGNLGYDALVKEKKRLKRDEEEIGKRKANINGQIGTLEAQKMSLDTELNSAMYKDIDVRFKETVVNLKISEAQALDLLRYSAAMEFAMGQYHKRQMERVNSYIREYWSKIYRGNDIDYIEIHAEAAEVTSTRRSFNYKLVQRKGYAMLDMRNRCSAGQKMLACLIVRMALAEVFSSNCGILTLDEPTTNLDKKNIRMLAETLNDLIVAKSSLANTNFQLIIITHDKEFLQQITSANAVERYVEVSRSHDGTSQVTLRNVTD